MGVKQYYDILSQSQPTNTEVTQEARSLGACEEHPWQNSWKSRELAPGCVDSYNTLTFITAGCEFQWKRMGM